MNLIASCIITIFSSVVQAASLNHAGNMPPKYIEAVVSG